MIATIYCLFAQAAGGAADPGAGGNPAAGFQPLIFFGMILLLAWFIILRPAQRQEKQRKLAILQLKKGDDVTFAGGILGTVLAIKEKNAGSPGDQDEITVKVLESKLRILRSSIYAINPSGNSQAQESASA